MSYLATHKPQALGIVTVTTPGTPVPLVAALVAAGIMISGDSFAVNKFSVWAPPTVAPAGWTGPTNSRTVYIGQKDMNKTTLAGVIATLQPGDVWSSTNTISSNVYRLDLLYVDADHAGDCVYGNGDQA